MKVVFLSSLNGLGGGESNMLALVRELKRGYGVDPTVVIKKGGTLAGLAMGMGLQVVEIPGLSLRRGKMPFWSVGAYRSLKKLMGEIKPEIVHVNDLETLVYAAAARTLGKLPFKIVWVCHGWWWWQPKFWPFTSIYKQADRVLSVSKFVQDKLPENLRKAKGKIGVIHLGIDTNKFSPLVKPDPLVKELSKGGTLIGMIGRFQKLKGHMRLLEALDEPIEGRPYKIFFVGDNTFRRRADDRNIKLLKSAIERNEHWKSCVIWTGFRENIERVISALDIVVCPSDFETFGLVNLEAMASGKAVVSTNVGGPREVITNGENGFLFDPSKNQLKEKLTELVINKALRETFGKKARIAVENNFSIEKQAREVARVYKEVL
ncbi:MAG: hypothetical protein A2119_02160 [Candidatus Colwellbacteria bacterium GWA2_46_10]|uniref:Glycosyltransferase subfamily 4-like N-terminal domain-containing protein n=1 Tax=Candidatus Colwellbacteria bacterium GWA2_46_10 TaxID=1797684 RepID=A0A1G1YXP1_9BACT|nr:MAG: Glycosyltransferase [Microgenomates group bacterium GW2011_GWA1_Microgenomates_45_10]KKU19474.1 MAG: Glycosyltransferase [Parcubacteria group bacterium GW2011_GWA2_46_10]OGY56420.1 MAG: hypothetical protein A2119_02160 [Candidatus Colwellbacteria bacterium GWA2_46_10]